MMTKTASFTNLDKVFWPKEGYTKGDVIAYYDRIADRILPYLKDRPMVLNRHPNGIKGPSFFQKNVNPVQLPPFVKSVAIRAESTGRDVHYVVCNNKDTLLYLANLGCIEMHPWNSRTKSMHKPDYLVIDLDPGGNSFDEVVVVAQVVREVIESAGSRSYAKTSGKTGLHVYVPLGARYEFVEVRAAAKELVDVVNLQLPDLTSLERHPAKRKGKIYLDYLRNSVGQTLAALFSLRAYPGATVSAPLAWTEVKKGLRPNQFTIETIFRSLRKRSELWEPVLGTGTDLRNMMQRLQRSASSAAAAHRPKG